MRTDVFIHYGRDAPEVPVGWKLEKNDAGGWWLTDPSGKEQKVKSAMAIKAIVEAYGK